MSTTLNSHAQCVCAEEIGRFFGLACRVMCNFTQLNDTMPVKDYSINVRYLPPY